MLLILWIWYHNCLCKYSGQIPLSYILLHIAAIPSTPDTCKQLKSSISGSSIPGFHILVYYLYISWFLYPLVFNIDNSLVNFYVLSISVFVISSHTYVFRVLSSNFLYCVSRIYLFSIISFNFSHFTDTFPLVNIFLI